MNALTDSPRWMQQFGVTPAVSLTDAPEESLAQEALEAEADENETQFDTRIDTTPEAEHLSSPQPRDTVEPRYPSLEVTNETLDKIAVFLIDDSLPGPLRQDIEIHRKAIVTAKTGLINLCNEVAIKIKKHKAQVRRDELEKVAEMLRSFLQDPVELDTNDQHAYAEALAAIHNVCHPAA